jgi:hypothetical protein
MRAVDQVYMIFIFPENLSLPRKNCERLIKFKASIHKVNIEWGDVKKFTLSFLI